MARLFDGNESQAFERAMAFPKARGSAPGSAGAIPAPCQSLGDEHVPQGATVLQHQAKFATLSVDIVTANGHKINWASVDQLQQSPLGLVPKVGLISALRGANLTGCRYRRA
jgi:hypothetical protein